MVNLTRDAKSESILMGKVWVKPGPYKWRPNLILSVENALIYFSGGKANEYGLKPLTNQ